jgi:hypothetical protein
VGKAPAYQWYPGDFRRDPRVMGLTFTARAVWREILDTMFLDGHTGQLTGTVEQLARMCFCSATDIQTFLRENETLEVADVTFCNPNVTICNRRMVRAHNERENTRLRVARHRQKQECNSDVTPLSSSSSSSSCTKVHNSSSEVGTSDTAKSHAFSKGEPPYELALFLANLMRGNDPKAKVPKDDSAQWQKWCLTFDRMIRLDERQPGEIAAIINWAQDDSFWKANILSPDKLRQKFTQLYLQAKEKNAPLSFEWEDE